MQKAMNSLTSQLSRSPPNLLLNSDILDIFEPSRPVFALEKSIKQVNMKLFRSSTLLISFEIYITRLHLRFNVLIFVSNI